MTPDERLHAALGAAGAAPGRDVSRLASAAREALAQHPKMRPWWMDGLLVLGLNLLAALGAVALMSTASTQHASDLVLYGVAFGWLVLTAAGSMLWLRPGSPLPRWALVSAFVLVCAAMLLGASGFDPGLPFLRGAGCALIEGAVAFVPLAVAVGVSLRFEARSSHLVGVALACASGGALGLHFHCGNGTVPHLAVFHVVPALLLALTVVLIRRALRSRSFVP